MPLGSATHIDFQLRHAGELVVYGTQKGYGLLDTPGLDVTDQTNFRFRGYARVLVVREGAFTGLTQDALIRYAGDVYTIRDVGNAGTDGLRRLVVTLGAATTPVSMIVVTPTGLTILPGETLQFTAVAYDADGNILTGQAVTWASSDASIATVDAATGLATGVGGGSCSIIASVAGIQGASTLSVPDEPTFLRTNILGGDAILADHRSVRFNRQQGIGAGGLQRVTNLDDARGAAFGHSLTPSTPGNGLEVVGAGDTLVLRSSNGSDLRSVPVASACVGPTTYAFIGSLSKPYPGGLSFPYTIADDGLAASLILSQADSGGVEVGVIDALTNPSALYTHSFIPRDGRRRLVLLSIDETGLVTVESPPEPAFTRQLSGGQIPGATAARTWWGGAPGFPAISSEDFRADARLARFRTTADKATLVRWARGYHRTINGSKNFVVCLGDSLTLGTSGPVDLSRNYPTKLFAKAQFNGAEPYHPVNLGVPSAWIAPGTNSGNNVTDNQLAAAQAMYDATRDRNIAILWVGTNPLASGIDAATVTAQHWTLCAAIGAIGYEVVIIPCIPRNMGAGDQAGFNSRAATFNANLADTAQWPSAVKAIVPLRSVAPFNSDTGYTDLAYFDGIHLLPSGYQLVADAAAAPVGGL